MALIEAAIEKGFLNAKIIKPAHVDIEINIPKGAVLYRTAQGDIGFADSKNNKSFLGSNSKTNWMGWVCFGEKWGKVVEHWEEDLTGRYIKVLRAGLGGQSNKYKVGDYLKVERKCQDCYIVEYAGILNLSHGPNHRVYMKDVELMPEGFDPNVKLGTAGSYPKLDKFPEGGVCWNPTKELQAYLILKTSAKTLPSTNDKYKGLAWNINSIWGVMASSSQNPYDISQLEPFFNIPLEPKKIGLDFMKSPNTDNFEIGKTYYIRESRDHNGTFMIAKCEGFNTNDNYRINGPYLSNMMTRPNFNFRPSDTPWIGSDREVCLASEEDTKWLECCIQNKKFIELENVKRYPETLVSEIKVGDKFIINNPGNPSDGIKGVVGRLFKEDGIDKVELARPLPKYPGGGELFAVPLSRVRLCTDIPDYQKHYPLTPDECYPKPEKWCMVVTSYNEDILNKFLHGRGHEWVHYSKDWKVGPGGTTPNYFHYPPASREPCHSHWKIQQGYTEITTEQFKKFYNSNSNSNDHRRQQFIGTSSESSIKIQRPNLEIRHSDTIRATSFRCTKGKINLGG